MVVKRLYFLPLSRGRKSQCCVCYIFHTRFSLTSTAKIEPQSYSYDCVGSCLVMVPFFEVVSWLLSMHKQWCLRGQCLSICWFQCLTLLDVAVWAKRSVLKWLCSTCYGESRTRVSFLIPGNIFSSARFVWTGRGEHPIYDGVRKAFQ